MKKHPLLFFKNKMAYTCFKYKITNFEKNGKVLFNMYNLDWNIKKLKIRW